MGKDQELKCRVFGSPWSVPTALYWEQPGSASQAWRKLITGPSEGHAEQVMVLRSILRPPSLERYHPAHGTRMSPPAPRHTVPLLTVKQRCGLLDGLRDLLQAGDGRALGSTSRKD